MTALSQMNDPKAFPYNTHNRILQCQYPKTYRILVKANAKTRIGCLSVTVS